MARMKTLGIVGGGQLARMLAEAAHGLGIRVIVLDPTPQSPGGQVADEQIVGSFTDAAMIKELAEKCDVLTFETESADNRALLEVSSRIPVHPAPDTLAVIKDKYAQKQFLQTQGIPTADFADVPTFEDAREVGRQFGYPFVLKAKRDSYDGKGNALVESEGELVAAFEKLKGRDLYAERLVPFTKELAVVAARSLEGEVTVFPVVETVHRNHICDTVTMPASINESVSREAEEIARKTLGALQGAGVFAIEMFEADRVLVNEIAPRVHNSGHLTIEACETSQFEQHVRAVMGIPLGDTRMKVPAAMMLNILGTKDAPSDPQGFEDIASDPHTSVHLYGKKESRIGRKMGHVTVTGETMSQVAEQIERIRARVTI